VLTRKEFLKQQRERKDKRPKWLRKLSVKDIQHLKEGLEVMTLHTFKEAIELQKRHSIICKHCMSIAVKIGLEKRDEI